MNKQTVLIVIAALIFIGLLWLLLGTGDNQPTTTNNEQDSGSLNSNLPDGDANNNGSETSFAKLADNAIYVAEQRPGNKIIVNKINIVPEGYVVIHESKNGTVGKILGYATLEANSQLSNVTVNLDRSVTDEEELIAMLHADNGDNTFNASDDNAVLDSLGNPLSMTFSVSAGAPDPASIEIMF